MRKRVLVWLTAVMVSGLMGASGWAAEDFDTTPTPATDVPATETFATAPSVEQQLADLKQEVQSLREQLAEAARPMVPVETSDQATEVEVKRPSVYERPAEEQRTAAQDWKTWLEVKFAELENKLAGIDQRLYSLEQAVKSPSGEYTVARTPYPAEATFVVANLTGMDQYVAVNGQRRYFPPGRTEVKVPHGTVTTELIGFEEPRTWDKWRRDGDRYQMELQIKD